MRRIFLALLIFLAVGPVPGAVVRHPQIDHSLTIDVRPLDIAAATTGRLRFVRGWQLSSPHSKFGSFSAIARRAPGRFLLFGDNGYWTRLTIRADGKAGEFHIAPIPNPGQRSSRKSSNDVEAAVVDRTSGRIWIALESINEIRRLDASMLRVEARRRLPGWPANRGPEAMVQLRDGRTIVFSEDADDDARGRAALVFSGDPTDSTRAPQSLFYDSQGQGLVSDAALLPDGRVLLVHRRLGFDPVFTTELAILDPADIRKDGVVRSQPLGRIARAIAENYEGAIVAVEDGRTMLWLVSDHNFNRWQRSLLVQFELVDLPPRQQKGGAVPGPP